MTRRLHACLLASVLFCHSGTITAAEDKTVQDLHYGDVLFHFYKEDYFTAITRLMSVLDRNLLQHHTQDAELLLGGMELSYGMPNEARKQFLKTFDETVPDQVRQRSWYFLGKSAYQRKQLEQARSALTLSDQAKDAQLGAQQQLLLATIDMRLGHDQSAAEKLQDIDTTKGNTEYLQINRGIALLRSQQIEAGQKELDKLGQLESDNPEFRALRDRANLNLGYEMLRNNQVDQARIYLNRVRLHGPYAMEALLGAGWADAEQGNYEKALAPWLELLGRRDDNPAVHEAHLAVPYAFERLNDEQNALYYYENAVAFFEQQQQALRKARQSINEDMLDTFTIQPTDNLSTAWLQNDSRLQTLSAAPYLVDVLASNDFQHQLKNYRDLLFLRRQLQQWELNIKPLHDVVDTLRQANAQRAPSVQRLLEADAAGTLQERYKKISNEIIALDNEDNPIGLATTKELAQWHRLERLKKRITALPDIPHQQHLAAKTRWLQGILSWQIQTDYEQRLTKIKELFAATKSPVRATQANQARVARVLKNIGIGFAGDDNVIDQLQTRISQLRPDVEGALVATGLELKTIALTALESRELRLQNYLNQAHYALARNYDRLAQQIDNNETQR